MRNYVDASYTSFTPPLSTTTTHVTLCYHSPDNRSCQSLSQNRLWHLRDDFWYFRK